VGSGFHYCCIAGVGSLKMAKSNEPIWWSLFSAGGMVAAMIFPVLIIITGILIPFGLAGDNPLNYERIHTAVAHNNYVKLIFFIVISLPLFHWAHRFRFTLVDVGLKSISTLISILCYGGAIAGTIISAIVFLNI